MNHMHWRWSHQFFSLVIMNSSYRLALSLSRWYWKGKQKNALPNVFSTFQFFKNSFHFGNPNTFSKFCKRKMKTLFKNFLLEMKIENVFTNQTGHLFMHSKHIQDVLEICDERAILQPSPTTTLTHPISLYTRNPSYQIRRPSR